MLFAMESDLFIYIYLSYHLNRPKYRENKFRLLYSRKKLKVLLKS